MPRIAPNKRWNDIRKVLKKYDVSIDECEDGYFCKRTVNGKPLQPLVIPGRHKKNFEVKVPYINLIIRNLDIPRSEFE